MEWKDRSVLVTGGTSFIGSRLVDALLERGARVRVIDDLSSGRLENIRARIEAGQVALMQADLKRPGVAEGAVEGISVVFHLAADHGGRGYVDLHQAACATNLMLDGMVFAACRKAGVEKVVYASSGCVYPNHLQADPNEILYLTEDMVGPPYDADNMYGWAKLMGEMTLRSYYRDWGMKSASCRYFTVYGPRGVENHAVIAMIARAFIGQDPFVVWGTGEQVRNWTYIDDIVRGAILAAGKRNDAVIGAVSAVLVNDLKKLRLASIPVYLLLLFGIGARVANPVREDDTGPGGWHQAGFAKLNHNSHSP